MTPTDPTDPTNHRFPRRVDNAGRALLDAAGARWFLLADTAWELFHRLDDAETDSYLRTRRRQGFNAVQAVVLAELDGLREPAVVGGVPFENLDPDRPRAAFFDRVAAVVKTMNALGLLAVLLPTWGDKVNQKHGDGPEVLGPENAFRYGRFLGERLHGREVLWTIGGDRSVDTPRQLLAWRALAEGIVASGHPGLLTFHPDGGRSSSAYVRDEAWLDLHSVQTGHTGRDAPIEENLRRDLAMFPPRPVWNSEPCYEAHPVMRADRGWRPRGATFKEADVRDAAYRSVFSGACGHAYGCHAVWQMHDPERERMNEPVNFPAAAWHRQLELPGANQMRHLAAWMASEPDWEPDPDPTADGSGPGGSDDPGLPTLRTARGSRLGVYALAALPPSYLKPWLERAAQRVPGAACSWFDPRTGGDTPADPTDPTRPPDAALDWVFDVRAR